MKNIKEPWFADQIKTLLSQWGWASKHEVYVTENKIEQSVQVTYPKPNVKNHSDQLEQHLRNTYRDVKRWKFGWY